MISCLKLFPELKQTAAQEPMGLPQEAMTGDLHSMRRLMEPPQILPGSFQAIVGGTAILIKMVMESLDPIPLVAARRIDYHLLHLGFRIWEPISH